MDINDWLVVWNKNFSFHIWDVIPTPLTNSIIFEDGYCTTNQIRTLALFSSFFSFRHLEYSRFVPCFADVLLFLFLVSWGLSIHLLSLRNLELNNSPTSVMHTTIVQGQWTSRLVRLSYLKNVVYRVDQKNDIQPAGSHWKQVFFPQNLGCLGFAWFCRYNPNLLRLNYVKLQFLVAYDV